jgi:hypothetical protein
MRNTFWPLTEISGEPAVAGPVTPCGQRLLPWESPGQWALSVTRDTGGMSFPFRILLEHEFGSDPQRLFRLSFVLFGFARRTLRLP